MKCNKCDLCSSNGFEAHEPIGSNLAPIYVIRLYPKHVWGVRRDALVDERFNTVLNTYHLIPHVYQTYLVRCKPHSITFKEFEEEYNTCIREVFFKDVKQPKIIILIGKANVFTMKYKEESIYIVDGILYINIPEVTRKNIDLINDKVEQVAKVYKKLNPHYYGIL